MTPRGIIPWLKEGKNPRARPARWGQTQENLALVYQALFDKTRAPRYLDDALNAVDGALEEYRKAEAAFYIEKAERLRAKILAEQAKLQTPGLASTRP